VNPPSHTSELWWQTHPREFEVTFCELSKRGTYRAFVEANAFCNGDSGGPLFDSTGRLVGIASAALAICNDVETRPRTAYYVPMKRVLNWVIARTGCASVDLPGPLRETVSVACEAPYSSAREPAR
jgi:hypothetical protein